LKILKEKEKENSQKVMKSIRRNKKKKKKKRPWVCRVEKRDNKIEGRNQREEMRGQRP
jgi:hypothetical protein